VRPELRDALSALADGEVADPDLVAEALLEPDAPALIVTLAEARAHLRDTTSEPSAALSASVEQALAAHGRRPALVLLRTFTPALYAGLGLTAGILVGVLLAPGSGPMPTIAVRTPAPAVTTGAPATPLPVPRSIAPPPLVAPKALPPPARSVYRFEVGRNWREGS
jgi:hypothetical protein